MKEGTKKAISLLLAIIGSIALFARNELYQGEGANIAETVLHRFYNSFNAALIPAIVVALALFCMFKRVLLNEERFYVGTYIFSFALSFLYLLCTYYTKYDSSFYLYANSYQLLMSGVCVIGLSFVFYAALLLLREVIDKENPETVEESFFTRHFFVFSSAIIFAFWMVWVLGNYPGTGNVDSEMQLKNFLGETQWSAWHPPLSSVIMGVCFSLGSLLWNANFGYFLYCLFQSVTGTLIFSFGLKKLKEYGVSIKYCVGGICFFALLPVWGSFAQYFEKDFLYTQLIVLQLIFMADIIHKKECTKKSFIKLTLAGLAAVFLRNNGIYAVVPAVLLLGFLVKGASKKYVFASLAIVLVLYEGIVRVGYPLLGVESTSVSETYGILFQQTAKFVTDYPDEVLPEEKEILDSNFQGIEHLNNYDPRIFDPVKIYYNNADFKGYMRVWISQFKRHPGTYFEATLNGAYGYLAPVDTDMGAWLQETYDDYQIRIGLSHPYSGPFRVLLWIWNIAKVIPVLNVLCMPGFYTWIILLLAWILLVKKKKEGLVLLVPSLINVLVCVASPLANAMRYALPVTAAVPFLIGMVIIVLKRSENV